MHFDIKKIQLFALFSSEAVMHFDVSIIKFSGDVIMHFNIGII